MAADNYQDIYGSPLMQAIQGGNNPQNNTAPTPQGQQQPQATQPPASQPSANTQGGSQPAQGAQTPGTPVTATGGIPPYTPPPPVQYVAPPAPTEANTAGDLRYAKNTAAQVTYDPTQHAEQFGYNDSGVTGGQSGLINAILGHPDTMGADQVGQMKEAQKEQALLLGKQDEGNYLQSLLARGGGAAGVLGSPATAGFRQANGSNVNNNILTGNRDIDIKAAQTNRQNELDAVRAAEEFQQGNFGRQQGAFGTNLAGKQFNAGQDQAAYASRAKANDDAFQRALQIASSAQGAYGQDANNAQFGANLSATQRNNDNNLAFNYDQLAQNGNLSNEAILAQLMNA